MRGLMDIEREDAVMRYLDQRGTVHLLYPHDLMFVCLILR